jgi:hypothetical protein
MYDRDSVDGAWSRFWPHAQRPGFARCCNHDGVTIAGTLMITRSRKSWMDRARTYKIFVDGDLKGTVRNGEQLILPIASGPHTSQARIDWTGSPAVPFEVAPGETVRMRVEARANPFTALWYVFGATRYLSLTRID